MPEFQSYQKHVTEQRTDRAGKPLYDDDGLPKMQQIKVLRWSTEAAINFLRSKGRQMAREACRDGWHVNLIDFVQHQHALPNPDECEQLVRDFQKIEHWTQHSPKRQQILENRERIKTQLMRPLTADATA